MVLANKADVPGAASTTAIHDRICRAEGSPLGSGGGGVSVLTSGGASGHVSGPGGSGGGAGGTGSSGAPSGGGSGKREYRLFTCSALRGEGVREGLDWMVGAAKAHMYARNSRGEQE